MKKTTTKFSYHDLSRMKIVLDTVAKQSFASLAIQNKHKHKSKEELRTKCDTKMNDYH